MYIFSKRGPQSQGSGTIGLSSPCEVILQPVSCTAGSLEGTRNLLQLLLRMSMPCAHSACSLTKGSDGARIPSCISGREHRLHRPVTNFSPQVIRHHESPLIELFTKVPDRLNTVPCSRQDQAKPLVCVKRALLGQQGVVSAATGAASIFGPSRRSGLCACTET